MIAGIRDLHPNILNSLEPKLSDSNEVQTGLPGRTDGPARMSEARTGLPGRTDGPARMSEARTGLPG